MTDYSFTSADVIKLRKELGCSLPEARKVLVKHALMSAIVTAVDINDLKAVIFKLIEEEF